MCKRLYVLTCVLVRPVDSASGARAGEVPGRRQAHHALHSHNAKQRAHHAQLSQEPDAHRGRGDL